jgi:hypothetical protein
MRPVPSLRAVALTCLPACMSLASLSSVAAPVVYEITGTLNRVQTLGVDIEPYVAALGFDGGSFRATVTLDRDAADSDASATRGLYVGAVLASTLEVAGTGFGGPGYCNLDPLILDCSVEALDNQPLFPGSTFLQDQWRLNSQVFEPAPSPGGSGAGLPAGFIGFLTFDLLAGALGLGQPSPLFDSTALDFGLDQFGQAVPGLFTLDLRGTNFDTREEFGVFWQTRDVRVAAVSAVPEPGTGLLALGALGAWWMRGGARRARRPAAAT